MDEGTYRDLLTKGTDVTSAQDLAGGQVRIELVLTPQQVARSARSADRRLRRQLATDGPPGGQFQASNGFNVWRDYDGDDGMVGDMVRTARGNSVASLEVIGRTNPGTPDLRGQGDPEGGQDEGRQAARCAVQLHQHAREWIASETNRRLMHWYVDKWNAKDKAVRKLLKKTELWFVLVANPDGYQYVLES